MGFVFVIADLHLYCSVSRAEGVIDVTDLEFIYDGTGNQLLLGKGTSGQVNPLHMHNLRYQTVCLVLFV